MIFLKFYSISTSWTNEILTMSNNYKKMPLYKKRYDHSSLRCSGDIITPFAKLFTLNLLCTSKNSSNVLLVQFVALPLSVT